MKRKLFCLLLLFSVSTLYSQKPISVLLITSDRKLPTIGFYEMFENMGNINYKEVKQFAANEWIENGKANDFDVLVFYDLCDSITEVQKEGYWELLQNGKPMLFLHHTLVSYQKWAEFSEILGGRYYRKNATRGASTFKHNVEIKIKRSKTDHPITRGIDNFSLIDELYGNCEILPSVTPLLLTSTSGNMKYVAWIHKVREANVVYIQNGHSDIVFHNVFYQKLIHQTINYLFSNSKMK